MLGCGSPLQAPIKVFGIEGRYAHALFSAASKKKAIDKVESELGDFQVRIFVDKLQIIAYMFMNCLLPSANVDKVH